MATRFRFNPDSPKWVQRVDVLTRASNPDILRFLMSRGRVGATSKEVCEALDIHPHHAPRLLRNLEDVGLVKGTPAPDVRGRGRTVTWRAQPARIKVTIEDLYRYIYGADADQLDLEAHDEPT